MKRKYLSGEIHEGYYEMILERIGKEGNIPLKYKPEFIKEKKLKSLFEE